MGKLRCGISTLVEFHTAGRTCLVTRSYTGALLISMAAHVDDVKGIQFIDHTLISGGLDNICRLYGTLARHVRAHYGRHAHWADAAGL